MFRVLLLCCIVFSASVPYGGWVIETVDSWGSVGWTPAIALDSEGLPGIVYARGGFGARYAEYDVSGSWTNTVLDNGSDSPRST